LGVIAMQLFQWAEAEAAYRKAIELNPRLPTAHHWYALCLLYQGRIPEAYAETDRAHWLDPTSPILNNLVGITRAYARDFDGAVEALKKTIEMAPNFGPAHLNLGWVYAAQGRYTEAFAAYNQPVASDSVRELMGVTYVLAGRPADARRLIEEMEQRAKREYVSPAARGLIWVMLGERDRGYALLARACAESDWDLAGWKDGPLIDRLRAEPRWHEVLRCIHLE